MRLSRLQQIGLIVSVLWIVFGGFWDLYAVSNGAMRRGEHSSAACISRDPSRIDACAHKGTIKTLKYQDEKIGNVFLVTFGPVVAIWLLGWAVTAAIRRRGNRIP